jgi:hypothetical protein
MRLIKLRIKNIASLKGEHEIDFASIQSQSPLFAITGEQISKTRSQNRELLTSN